MFQLSSVSTALLCDCKRMPNRLMFLSVTPGGRFQRMGPLELLLPQLGSVSFLRMVEYSPGGAAVRDKDVGGGCAVAAEIVVARVDGDFERRNWVSHVGVPFKSDGCSYNLIEW